MVERSRQRLVGYEEDKRFEDVTMTIFQRAIEVKCADIERQRDAKLHLTPEELADYALEIADQILHPDRLF